MDFKKLTNFIVDRSGYRLPLIYKLIHAPNLISKDDNLTIHGNLDLEYSIIRQLPEDLIVQGSLNVVGAFIQKLPGGLVVLGDLALGDSYQFRHYPTLPPDLQVLGTIEVDYRVLEIFQKRYPQFADKFVSYYPENGYFDEEDLRRDEYGEYRE